MNIYEELKERFRKIICENGLNDEMIEVDIKPLTPKESIGNPKRRDFPILTGKESMVEACFKSSKGQAFTLARSEFTGSLNEVLKLELQNDYNKAIFIASLNAVLKHLGLIEHTIHCKNEEPEQCALHMIEYFKENFSDKNIALIGYQPAILEALSKEGLNVRILDLNCDNIGVKRYGILVEDGKRDLEDVKKWADVFLVTGSTLANDTIENFLNLPQKVIFYGNTIAGAAFLLNLQRLCFKAS